MIYRVAEVCFLPSDRFVHLVRDLEAKLRGGAILRGVISLNTLFLDLSHDISFDLLTHLLPGFDPSPNFIPAPFLSHPSHLALTDPLCFDQSHQFSPLLTFSPPSHLAFTISALTHHYLPSQYFFSVSPGFAPLSLQKEASKLPLSAIPTCPM